MLRTARELGRLRFGELTEDSKGAKRPSSRDTWLVTSDWAELLQILAGRYGGTVSENTGNGSGVYALSTTAGALVARVDPMTGWDAGWEQWRGGVRQKRCEGVGESCSCPEDVGERLELSRQRSPQACRPVGRLRVRLSGIPGPGVWRVETHSPQAINQIGDFVATAGEIGLTSIDVELALDRRRGPELNGKPTTFVVPVLRRITSSQSQDTAATRPEVVAPEPPAAASEHIAQAAPQVASTPLVTAKDPTSDNALADGSLAGRDDAARVAAAFGMGGRAGARAAAAIGEEPVPAESADVAERAEERSSRRPRVVPAWFTGVRNAAEEVADACDRSAEDLLAQVTGEVCGPEITDVMDVPTNKVPALMRALRSLASAA